MSNPSSLFLLADHIKLSLLERQRAQSTPNVDSDSQDGHISRSLDQLRNGLEALQREQDRLAEAGNTSKDEVHAHLADAIPELQKQYDDLMAQFHGFASPSAAASAADNTLTSSKNPTLAVSPGTKKTVRFSDAAAAAAASFSPQRQPNPLQHSLFPYRDDPNAPQGYRDQTADASVTNQQVHAYHAQILSEQDAQLDALGASISRQRELSLQMGDELDSQVLLLDESDRLVDRHQGRLDRARRQVGRFAQSAGESKQMMAIIILIIVLVLLIIMLK